MDEKSLSGGVKRFKTILKQLKGRKSSLNVMKSYYWQNLKETYRRAAGERDEKNSKQNKIKARNWQKCKIKGIPGEN